MSETVQAREVEATTLATMPRESQRIAPVLRHSDLVLPGFVSILLWPQVRGKGPI